MATKPIISIDVDDSAFKRFNELFGQYSAKLEEMPETWKTINEAMGGAGKELSAGAMTAKDMLAVAAAQAGLISEALRGAVRAQSDLDKETKRSSSSMDKLRKGAEGVGGAIKTIGGWIVRIGAMGGLGGLFAGLGVADLASATLSRSRASGRLGLSPGELSSFQVNLQQYLGTDAVQGALGAQMDASKWAAFSALGIDTQRALGMSPQRLAVEALENAVDIYRQDKKNRLPPGSDPRLKLYQSMLGGDMGNVINASMHGGRAAIEARYADYRRDIPGLQIPEGTQQEWIAFKRELDRAGVTIQTVFIDKLGGLTPSLSKLTGEVVGLINSFANAKNFDRAINTVETGLHNLAEFFDESDPKFHELRKNLKDFGAEMGVLVDKLRFLLPHETPKPKPLPKDVNPWGLDAMKFARRPDQYPMAMLSNNAKIIFRRAAGDYSPAYIHAMNHRASRKYGVPLGIMERLAMDESSYGKNLISGAGAMGVYQFMPDTAKGYGIDPLNTAQASDASGKMLSSLYKKYNDWSKVIAAYNWGEGNLDRDIRKHKADWLKYAPKETQGEVSNVVGGNAQSVNADIAKTLKKAVQRQAPKMTSVIIRNHTAGRVAVSVNAVAV